MSTAAERMNELAQKSLELLATIQENIKKREEKLKENRKSRWGKPAESEEE